MATRTLYVCNLCSTAYCHPLQYCSTCPGKLSQTKIEYKFLSGNYSTAEWLKNHNKQLAIHGLKDGGI